ncbi:hypothetical protein GCM10025762_50040 [Haloechinothrix salitolerans]
MTHNQRLFITNPSSHPVVRGRDGGGATTPGHRRRVRRAVPGRARRGGDLAHEPAPYAGTGSPERSRWEITLVMPSPAMLTP